MDSLVKYYFINVKEATLVILYKNLEVVHLKYMSVAQMVKRLSTMREIWVQSLGWEDSLEKEVKPTPVLLPRKSHGRSSLVSMGSQRVGHDFTFTFTLDSLDQACYSKMWYSPFKFQDALYFRIFTIWLTDKKKTPTST